MAGWDQLGAALTGNDAGNELAYARGASISANTQNALAEARERVAKNQAREVLGSQLTAAGLPQNIANASATGLSAGAGLGDVLGMLGKQQEQTFRADAANPDTPFPVANRRLMGVASGPVERFASAGEGLIQDKFSDAAPVTSALGDALIDQRHAAAALDNERRTNPAAFRTTTAVPGGGKIVQVGGVPFVFKGMNEDGTPNMVALADVKTVTDNIGATTGAKVEATGGAKATIAAKTGLPGIENDIDNMVSNINNLLSAPGFDRNYGVTGAFPSIPGGDAANAAALRDQVSSQSFQVSIQKMRGLGALSDAEGKKVQAAFTAAAEPGLSAPVARDRYKVALAQLENLRTIARQEAGGNFNALPSPNAAAPAAQAGGYADPDKEARYQAFKASQGAQ